MFKFKCVCNLSHGSSITPAPPSIQDNINYFILGMKILWHEINKHLYTSSVFRLVSVPFRNCTRDEKYVFFCCSFLTGSGYIGTLCFMSFSTWSVRLVFLKTQWGGTCHGVVQEQEENGQWTPLLQQKSTKTPPKLLCPPSMYPNFLCSLPLHFKLQRLME